MLPEMTHLFKTICLEKLHILTISLKNKFCEYPASENEQALKNNEMYTFKKKQGVATNKEFWKFITPSLANKGFQKATI